MRIRMVKRAGVNKHLFFFKSEYKQMFIFFLTTFYMGDILFSVRDMTENILKNDIRYLKGVGERSAALLNNLGIFTYQDLLEYYPRNYEDRTTLKKLNELMNNESAVFIGEVSTKIMVHRIRKNLTISSFFVEDETGSRIQISIFNQAYVKNKLGVGIKYAFYGKAEYINGRCEVQNPVIVDVDKVNDLIGIYPIYTLTKGVTNNYLHKLIKEVLKLNPELNETLDMGIRKIYNLEDTKEAIQKIHNPKSFAEVEVARKRLIFEELFLLQLALLSIKNKNLHDKLGISFKDIDYKEFKEMLPFELTNSQKKCIAEILNNMQDKIPMNRLLQGDVGSGKTIVAAIALYIAVKNGYQGAMMAPTTILSNQHYAELKDYFEKLGMKTQIITGATTKKKKEEIVKELEKGEIDILFGTHAIIEDNVKFKSLGLIITDEQHRFGVKQRMKLNAKGKDADVLVMTATPIPRTLSLMLYSDLDMSVIDELPPGRISVKTYVVDESYEPRIISFIQKELDKDKQAYIVCPLIESNEELDLTDAKTLYENYKENIFKNYSVGFLNGKMKTKEKDEVMSAFKEKKINLLVSTTVIEVGVNVPDATLMIVENADRFGLATLHQLRGRVGRSKFESYCILKSKGRSKEVLERLDIMTKSNNGLEIAEKDMNLRGPGDFFGLRQHGLPVFKLANLLTDMQLLKKSNEAAKEVLHFDPDLNDETHETLRKTLFEKYSEQLSNIGT